jgi:hypothetical protein
MKIYCSHCGSACDETAAFCQSCGKPLAAVQKQLREALVPDEAASIPVSIPHIDAPSAGLNFKANKLVVSEKTCLKCAGPFTLAEDVVRCERCNGVLHRRCWDAQNGCSNDGCRSDLKKCPKCGSPIQKSALKCRFCNAYLDESVRPRAEGPKTVAEGAVASLVTGIIGLLVFGFIMGWFAISNGRKAFKIIDAEPDRFTGKGLAIAGIALGGFDILCWVVIIISRFQ